MDVLSASTRDSKIAWYENDGSENFTPHIITTDALEAKSVYAIDIDSDGDTDVLSASRIDGKVAWYENTGVVGIVDNNTPIIPVTTMLYDNYPNPFNPATAIKYQILDLSFVILKVYDVLGNEIATLVNEEKIAGTYAVEFSANGGGRDLTSGIYFYRLQAGDFVQTKKMILLK